MKTKLTSFYVAAACLALLCATSVGLQAATIIVTSTADSGAGTLRGALGLAANGDTIDASGLAGTITLTSGQLSVANSLTLLGPGPGVLTVSGNNAFRVFYVTGANVTISGLTIANGYGALNGAGIYGGSSAGSSLTISECVVRNNNSLGNLGGGGIFNIPGVMMTITNCTVSTNSANGWGGGIYNEGVLAVVDSIIRGNAANSIWGGGGIMNDGEAGNASLTIKGSIVSGNGAGMAGGIMNDGEAGNAILTINQSTISGNGASSSVGAGGGIFNDGYDGEAALIITASTISGNVAALGGGIGNNGERYGHGALEVTASTISSNTAQYGGGILNDGQNHGAATAYLSTATVSGNSANAGLGGGVHNNGEGGAAALYVSASTFNGNTASAGGSIGNDGYGGAAWFELGDTILSTTAGGNIYNYHGTTGSDGYNLSSDAAGGDATTGPGGFLNSLGDIRNTNPKLGPLQDNGGPTLTHGLLTDSPAIDEGKTNTVPGLVYGTDQRGLTRVVEFLTVPDAPGGDGSDIGAFEVQNTQPTTVTSTADSGPGSLRAAVADYVSGDSIGFDPSLSGATILLTSGQIALNQNLTIDGSALPGGITINGNQASRIFQVGIGVTVGLNSLTITNGIDTGGGNDGGGGILNYGALTLNNCTVAGNSSQTGWGGGGILSYNGTLTLNQCTVAGNASGDYGGGIISYISTLTLNQCTVAGNSAGYYGGGINSDSGALTLNQCTVAGNSAGYGGGIYNNQGALSVLNSTFSSNSAVISSVYGEGGGIYNNQGTLGILNSTFSGNAASYSGGGALYNASFGGSAMVAINASTFSSNSTYWGGGGCLFNDGSGGGSVTMQIADTILNGGAAAAGNIFNLSGTIGSAGYNLSSDASGTTFLNQTGDRNNTDPKLGPLQNNGGPTWTHALLTGSPALDQGKRDAITALATNTDQRGFVRPIDNPNLANAPGGDGSDIGAYEAQYLLVSDAADGGPGSLRTALAGATDGDTIDATGLSGTITLTSGQLNVPNSVTILGPGAGVLTVSGNNASGVFNVTGANVTISGLTIANGQSAVTGAGIYAGGSAGSVLTVNNCVITDNGTAESGGGIYNSAGVALSISNCTISGNYAAQNGGGIYNSNATLAINASTFSGNSANQVGGAVLNYSLSGSAALTIDACTFSSNSAWSGGGIVNYCDSGSAPLTINATTFSGNSAASGIGGGLQNAFGAVVIGDTILNAGAAGGNLYNYAGTVISDGYNLSSDDGSGFLTATGDRINTDPKLGPLQDNGGPTWTHGLLSGSPAIDQGKRDAVPALALATDQRGFPRPSDNPNLANAPGGDGSDIGAYEAQYLIANSTADSGPGTLRAAAANYVSGDSIGFDPGLSGATILLTSGQIALNQNVTIDGSALPGGITINGNQASRIFQVGIGVTVALNSLTITNGIDTGGGNDGGGGILNYGALTLNNCTLAGNSSQTGWGGGGILSYNGTLTLNQCTVAGNSASYAGGGIISYIGTLTVNQCTVAGNSAGYGGGIYNSQGALSVLNSTFSSNSAVISSVYGEGGGIYIAEGAVSVLNSTFSGNAASYSGGGALYNSSFGGSAAVTINASTFSSNSTYWGGGGCLFNDGTEGGSATMQVGDTILNSGAAAAGNIFNISGTISSAGYNLSSDASGSTFLSQTGDQINTDPKIGPLQNNGGPTWTHALLTGSPALDQGKRDAVTALATNTDQRGCPRPVDNPNTVNAIGGDGSDIGAYEEEYSAMTLQVTGVAGHPDQKSLSYTPWATNRIYALQFTTNLATTPFAPLTGCSGPTTNGGCINMTDLNAGGTQKFYRIQLSSP